MNLFSLFFLLASISLAGSQRLPGTETTYLIDTDHSGRASILDLENFAVWKEEAEMFITKGYSDIVIRTPFSFTMDHVKGGKCSAVIKSIPGMLTEDHMEKMLESAFGSITLKDLQDATRFRRSTHNRHKRLAIGLCLSFLGSCGGNGGSVNLKPLKEAIESNANGIKKLGDSVKHVLDITDVEQNEIQGLHRFTNSLKNATAINAEAIKETRKLMILMSSKLNQEIECVMEVIFAMIENQQKMKKIEDTLSYYAELSVGSMPYSPRSKSLKHGILPSAARFPEAEVRYCTVKNLGAVMKSSLSYTIALTLSCPLKGEHYIVLGPSPLTIHMTEGRVATSNKDILDVVSVITVNNLHHFPRGTYYSQMVPYLRAGTYEPLTSSLTDSLIRGISFTTADVRVSAVYRAALRSCRLVEATYLCFHDQVPVLPTDLVPVRTWPFFPVSAVSATFLKSAYLPPLFTRVSITTVITNTNVMIHGSYLDGQSVPAMTVMRIPCADDVISLSAISSDYTGSQYSTVNLVPSEFCEDTDDFAASGVSMSFHGLSHVNHGLLYANFINQTRVENLKLEQLQIAMNSAERDLDTQKTQLSDYLANSTDQINHYKVNVTTSLFDAINDANNAKLLASSVPDKEGGSGVGKWVEYVAIAALALSGGCLVLIALLFKRSSAVEMGDCLLPVGAESVSEVALRYVAIAIIGLVVVVHLSNTIRRIIRLCSGRREGKNVVLFISILFSFLSYFIFMASDILGDSMGKIVTPTFLMLVTTTLGIITPAVMVMLANMPGAAAALLKEIPTTTPKIEVIWHDHMITVTALASFLTVVSIICIIVILILSSKRFIPANWHATTWQRLVSPFKRGNACAIRMKDIRKKKHSGKSQDNPCYDQYIYVGNVVGDSQVGSLHVTESGKIKASSSNFRSVGSISGFYPIGNADYSSMDFDQNLYRCEAGVGEPMKCRVGLVTDTMLDSVVEAEKSVRKEETHKKALSTIADSKQYSDFVNEDGTTIIDMPDDTKRTLYDQLSVHERFKDRYPLFRDFVSGTRFQRGRRIAYQLIQEIQAPV